MSQCAEAGRELQASWGSRVLEVRPPTLHVRRIQRSHSAQLDSLGAVSKQQTGPAASSRWGSFLAHPPGDARPWHGWGRAQPLPDMPGPTAGGEEALERGMHIPALCSLWDTDQSARGSQTARHSWSVTVQSSEKFRSAGGPRPVVGLAKGRPCQQGSWLAGSRPARVGQCVSGTRRGLPYPSLAEPRPSASRPSLLIPVLTALPVGGEPPIHARSPGASLSWMVSLVPRCPPCSHRRRGVWGPE